MSMRILRKLINETQIYISFSTVHMNIESKQGEELFMLELLQKFILEIQFK